jgi:hypothetical protein
MRNKLSTKTLLKRAKLLHNNIYDYSLVNYVNFKTKIKIICHKHGMFMQTPNNHLNGHGCNKCALELRSKNQRKSIKGFIIKANNVHGNKYDYSLVKYKNTHTKVIIICKKHGNFTQQPSHHINGVGCPQCSNNFLNLDLFIIKSIKTHGDYYNYSLVKYKNNKTKVKILCPEHSIFEQTPTHHLNGSGCPVCRESKGERIIRLFLIENNISYTPQKRFKECRDKYPLPFDFYINDLNICIEYDGKQHFKPVKQFGGENGFNDRIKKDNIKTKYCENNNIQLLRIKYNENINKKLKTIKL